MRRESHYRQDCVHRNSQHFIQYERASNPLDNGSQNKEYGYPEEDSLPFDDGSDNVMGLKKIVINEQITSFSDGGAIFSLLIIQWVMRRASKEAGQYLAAL